MIATWYAIVSFMLIIYIVLDGRNFGAGMLQWFVAKILILWCLILRGVSLEVGGHINDRLWQAYWDFIFVCSNFLLAILFGAAAGNVARGVPLNTDGNFSMAFFTDFNVRGHVGLLDWYTVSVAVLAVVMLAAHGATYLTLKTEGPVHDRCERWAKYLWIAVVPLLLVVLVESRIVRPDLPGRALSNPFWWIGLVVVATSTITLISGLATRRELRAFVGSNFLIVGLLATGAAAIFPVMLNSTLAPENSLTAYAVASSSTTLLRASFWWPIGFALAVFYFVFISRRYAGKVSVQRATQGFY